MSFGANRGHLPCSLLNRRDLGPDAIGESCALPFAEPVQVHDAGLERPYHFRFEGAIERLRLHGFLKNTGKRKKGVQVGRAVEIEIGAGLPEQAHVAA